MRDDLVEAFAIAKRWNAGLQKWTTMEEVEPEIPSDAVVVAVAYGQSEAKATVWVMSSKGLHVFRRGLLKATRSGEFLPIHLISGVAFGKSLMNGARLSTSGPQSNEELTSVDVKTAENFSKKAKDLLASISVGQVGVSTSAPAAPDIADQIRKLASLLSDGLLTQEEFDAKKAQILNL